MSGGSGGSASATGGLSLTSKGDLLTFNTAETRLPVSATNGQVLTTNSAVADGIEWATPVDISPPTTTKGDLSGYSTTQARIPIGSNTQVLTADSAQALGLKWATPAGGGVNLNRIGWSSSTIQQLGIFIPLNGVQKVTSAQLAFAQTRFRNGCVLDDLWVYVSANNNNSNTTLNVNDDGSDLSLSVTIPASTTGVFTDDSDPQTIADNSLVCYYGDPGSSTDGALTIRGMSLSEEYS